MERLEISVACRNYYGEDVAQLRTSQGISQRFFSEILAGAQCYTVGTIRVAREVSGKPRPGDLAQPLGNYNHTAAWNSMSEDWLVVEAGGKRHLPGCY